MTWLMIAVALVGLSGCTRYYWSKPGSTPEQFSDDSRTCARQASSSEAMRQQGIVSDEMYRACLASRGYRREKQIEPPPPGWYRGIE